ncbi:hypothetical protein GCM10027612_42780 [Microbispora bryophytorum subsp. camponoti]
MAHGCNVGMTPVIGGAKALRRDRLSHVDQTYLRLATYRAANATLIDAQAGIGLAQASGGGLVASVDGMRFVAPHSHDPRSAQRQVLRPGPRRHLAEHAERPGVRPGRHGRGRHPARLAVRPGRAV